MDDPEHRRADRLEYWDRVFYMADNTEIRDLCGYGMP
jgi:hypothetical protein